MATSDRHKLVLLRVNIAVDDTDYTLIIPAGASDVRVALNNATRAWRYGTSDVHTPGDGMLVAAGQPAEFGRSGAQLRRTELHVAVSTGGGVGLYACMSCLVPPTR